MAGGRIGLSIKLVLQGSTGKRSPALLLLKRATPHRSKFPTAERATPCRHDADLAPLYAEIALNLCDAP